MSHPDQSSAWTVEQALMRLSNPWLEVIGERLNTPAGQQLDYWRIKRADSAIIVPIWQGQLVLSPVTYRPGVGEVTLDFPGGRIAASQLPAEAAPLILQRELGLVAEDIQDLSAINSTGWAINSSLSNQRLFGFVAHLRDEAALAHGNRYPRYPLTQEGVHHLLADLPCLQCRSVLMHLVLQNDLGL